MATYVNHPKLVFVHVPKNGGTSVSFWLKEHLKGMKKGRTHGGMHHITEEGDQWADATTFVIVRNPWDRAVSFWSFLQNKIARKLMKAKKNPGTPAHLAFKKEMNLLKQGFESWAREGGLDYPGKQYPIKHWFTYGTNQVDWFPIEPNYILRYENLSNDFKQIQQFTGIYVDLPHANKSKHKDYRQYYTPELKNYIGDMFAKDVKRFNYDF